MPDFLICTRKYFTYIKSCVTVCGFTFSGKSSSSLFYPSIISQESESKRKVEFQYERLGHFHLIHICFSVVVVVAQMEKNGTNAFFFSSVIIIHSDVIFML